MSIERTCGIEDLVVVLPEVFADADSWRTDVKGGSWRSGIEVRTFVERNTIKVVHFVESWLPQTATWLYNQVKLLSEGVETYVVCQSTQNLDQFLVTNIFSLQSLSAARRLSTRLWCRLGIIDYREGHIKLLESVIRKHKPNILHSHFGHFGWINSGLARKYGLPHVVSFYGADIGYIPRADHRWFWRYRQMSDQVELVLCEGPYMARSIASLGFEPTKIRIFRLGIDLAQIPFVPRKNAIGGTIRFLIAGSFREKKGIPYALEALGLFSKSYSDMEVTVIGDSGGSEREESEKRKILDSLERSGLRAKTRFLGFQPHRVLIEEFYRHDIFISPSVTSSDGDSEGGAPVTIIEAAASGMPVIGTRHCDIPFVLSATNEPYLVSERDAVALCRAIEALTQFGDWDLLVSANRQLIEQELDVRRQAHKLADIYRLMLNSFAAEQQVGSLRS